MGSIPNPPELGGFCPEIPRFPTKGLVVKQSLFSEKKKAGFPGTCDVDIVVNQIIPNQKNQNQ
jgi:hypothetical protein